VAIGVFGTKAEAKAATDAHWASGDCDSTSVGPVYRLPDGREFASQDLPPGSLYEPCLSLEKETADFYPKGPDGLTVYAVCPDGTHWCIDGRANNCTLPNDDVHRCWVRTGDARAGNLDVGKVGGPTCAAGAGSIQTGAWHGFLHQGYFVEHDGQIPRGAPVAAAWAPRPGAPVWVPPPGSPDRRDPRRVGGWGS